MLISFFPTSCETWIDYSSHPDCIGVFDVDFDPNTQLATFSNWEVVITEKPIAPPPPETAEAKHNRIYNNVVTSTNLDTIDLEWEVFTDFEVGELITKRCFNSNPHAEKAITNKILAITLALLQWVEMTEGMASKIAEATAKKEEVDAVRNLFNLGNL